ncbi:hypothetical protein [Natrinema salsiterrestre]|uniref:Uncharacterized protein n=1 Tax=Natrinema salsiterrestre TaxID=2950540 RepID=A0A9Q4Q030_9EURY|nr:hypothetical protein [Natrinema salsiterrestre]MDF9745259.1 hypothetical protein [Natrinema salsiterrestre]
MSSIGAWLDETRADDRRRRLLVAGGVVFGLAFAWVHWLGFVAGGAVVALPQPSIRRGVLAGLGFGLLSALAFGGWIATAGVLDTYLTMEQVLVVSVVIPPACALFGSLVRGLR